MVILTFNDHELRSGQTIKKLTPILTRKKLISTDQRKSLNNSKDN